jgi:uncharacterized protein YjbI with pentapeptide repeats
MSGWDFSGKDLSGAQLANSNLSRAILSGAILTNAVITGADLSNTTGLTQQQLESTFSYQNDNLQGIDLSNNNLSGWDFRAQGADTDMNLIAARFRQSTLTGADFTRADVRGADFGDTTSRGFTQQQLYSTVSYDPDHDAYHDLRQIGLSGNDVSGWDFSGQDLRSADFRQATLADTDLAGADVRGADFSGTTSRGFTPQQLYSTESYQSQDLRSIRLSENDLSNWNLADRNLAGAELHQATLSGTDLSGADLSSADLRGASRDYEGSPMTRNAILPDGTINGLTLGLGDVLVVRDYPQEITIQDTMQLSGNGRLQLVLDGPDWDSTIIVQDGVHPQLHGTLSLTVDEEADVDQMMGRAFQLFDWGNDPPGDECFVHLDTPDYEWNTDQLCYTGEVRLVSDGRRPRSDAEGDELAGPAAEQSPLSFDGQGIAVGVVPIPEPSPVVLLVWGVGLLALGRGGRKRETPRA